jgi:hypothetical protein
MLPVHATVSCAWRVPCKSERIYGSRGRWFQHGLTTVAPANAAEDGWMRLVVRIAQRSLLNKAKTWYLGAHVRTSRSG